MPKHDRQFIRLDDAEGNFVHAVWSRSGKHLIVSIARRGAYDEAAQAELAPEQLVRLQHFLSETVTLPPADR